MKSYTLLLFFLFLNSFSGYNQEKLNDTLYVSGINREPLSRYVTYWVDSTKVAKITNVENNFSAKKFNYWNENSTLNLGKNPYPLWFHLNIKNSSKKYHDFWWGIYTQADTVTVYKKINNRFKSIDTILNSTLIDNKKVRTRFPAIKIELDALEAEEYFVKIQNLRNTQNAITDLTTPEDNLMWEKKFYWSIAFFVGCFLLISILSFVLGIVTKEKAFVFYTMYLLLILAMVLSEELMLGVVRNETLFYILNRLHSLPNAIIALSLHFMVVKFIFYQKELQSKIKLLSNLNLIFLFFGLLFAVIYFFFKEYMVFGNGFFPNLWQISIFAIFSEMILTLLIIILKFKKTFPFILSIFLGVIFMYYNPAGYFLNYAGILKYYTITYPNYFYWIVCIEFILIGSIMGWRYQKTLKTNYLLKTEKNKKKEKNFRKKIKIQQKERLQIAKDLHDDLGATLSAVKLIVTNSYKDNAPLVNMIHKANTDLRTFFIKLSLDLAKDQSIFNTLQEKIVNLNTIKNINISFITLGEEEEISKNLKQTIYKICNELLNNILKHSKAKEATIQIIVEKNQIEILAEDNGIGYKTQLNQKGMGIDNINHRIKKWNGNYYVSSNSNGTTSIIILPNKN